MVVSQFMANQRKHVKSRENLIKRYRQGYRERATARVGGESPPHLLRATALVFGPGCRARTQTVGGCSLAETPVLSRIGKIQSRGARLGPGSGPCLPGSSSGLRLQRGERNSG